MTRFLVDTHVLLWWAESSKLVSPKARIVMGSGRNQLYFSYASIWELNIKTALGRMVLPESGESLAKRGRCHLLPIELDHLEAIKTLPQLHGDPFDRMLISQAKTNGMTLLTRDRAILKYDLATLAA